MINAYRRTYTDDILPSSASIDPNTVAIFDNSGLKSASSAESMIEDEDMDQMNVDNNSDDALLPPNTHRSTGRQKKKAHSSWNWTCAAKSDQMHSLNRRRTQ